MRLTRPRAGMAALVVILIAVAVVVVRSGSDEGAPAPPSPPPNTIVPDQLVARLATEALGRAPTQDEWGRATGFFRARGCTADTVAAYAAGVYGGDEFDDLGYDGVERAIALYRGVLARDPDEAGVAAVTSELDDGRSWDDVVAGVLASDELRSGLAPAICAAGTPAYGSSNAGPPPDMPPAGDGFRGDQAALQQALNDAAGAGGTVALAPRTVVRLSSMLRIPAGVTLTTAGDPTPERYAHMGRLVRAGATVDGGDPVMVDLAAGARLRSVWVDGGRGWLEASRAAVSVRINADGGAVENAKLSEPLGGGNLFVSGPHFGVPCRTATVRNNLLTSYSSEHAQGRWADGISVACADATVAGNVVVDATDVSIILYRVDRGRQQSDVEDNVIIAAGRSAYGALGADPLTAGGQVWSFDGAEIRDNVLWTGQRTHVDIGLAVGTRAWFGGAADKGTGAVFTGNSTGDLSIRSTMPIAVSGMLDVTVQGNDLHWLPSDPIPCPPAQVAASRADGWASGSIQGPLTDLPVSGCFGEGVH